MAFSKYKGFINKKLNSELGMVVRSVRKEIANLKRTLVELSRQHSEHHKVVERFLALETGKWESCQQQTAKTEKIALPSEQLSKKEGKRIDDSTSDGQASANNEVELKYLLTDALEKNKQWLEYDQQREAYVRAILARMLWLERQLNEASQARSQQHNEDHSDEKEQIKQMQEHYEKLLQKATDELEVLREQLDGLRDETENLKRRLDEEKRRSANIEQQVSLSQKFLLNRHHADQEKIADLERQIKISSQDLEDERQDCSYLKKQMVRVLKMLQKKYDHVMKQSKRDQQDCNPCEEAHPPSSRRSSLNESFLECPACQAEYPASHYRDLLDHLEICQD